ncbi:MAG: hypothetical protein K0S44_1078 [Bacteroidetes bacterium]|jgi:hypothetical protein|nr:hypothetical protein [Bacteroidota bacterium]
MIFSVKLRVLCASVVNILLFLSLSSYSQEGRKYSRLKHRISVGPVITLIKNDPHFTRDTKAKAGFNAAYKAEILLGRKTNVLVGLEYMSQGLTFKGYYKANGYTYLYDETFSYTHEIRYNEVQVPIGLKLAFNSEKDRPSTAYLFGGIGFRYIFSSYIVIASDSTNTTPYDGKGTIEFEHQRVAKGLNGYYQGGLGIQKNYRSTSKALFLELTFKRTFSRIHYSGSKNSNNINFRDNNVAITIGLRL